MFKDIIYLKDVDQSTWDQWVCSIQEANYFHSFDWLTYINNLSDVSDNSSFTCIGDDGLPLAVCPLSLTYLPNSSRPEIASGPNPLGVPAFREVHPSFRRKLFDEVMTRIWGYARKHEAKKVHMVGYPLNMACCAGNLLAYRNSFEAIKYGMFYRVENAIIIDLALSEEKLFGNVSKYHRRHIKRGRKQGIEIEVFNHERDSDSLKNAFGKFQQAHFDASGKETRPQRSWDYMRDITQRRGASLFVATIENTPISYLFCGEFSLMAYGWSQVNLKRFEKEYSPRHLLEWEAIMHYKRQGFRFYEIGDRFVAPQLFHVPTEKEITISDFKERCGGIMLPKIYWTGYFDEDFMRQEITGSFERFFDKTSGLALKSDR